MNIPFDPARTLAVVVGIEKYDAGERWSLNGPALDAVRFVQWLRARSVPSENIRLFLSPLDRNVKDVHDALGAPDVNVPIENEARGYIRDFIAKKLPDITDSIKTLFIFWGGHGAMESDNQRRLFCSDASKVDLNPVNLESLLEALRLRPYSRITHQVVFVDACANYYSDMAYKAGQADQRFSGLESGGDVVDQVVLLAASSGEGADNDSIRRTGAFSEQFLQIISKAPASQWPDFEQVAHQIEKQFREAAFATGSGQQPVAMRWRTSGGAYKGIEAYPMPHKLQHDVVQSPLSIWQLREVVDSALKSGLWNEPSARDTLVATLPTQLSARISRRLGDAEQDLRQIFATMLATDEAAKHLIDVIEATNTNPAAVSPVLEVLNSARLAMIVRTYIAATKLGSADLLRAYHASLPDAQRAEPIYNLDEIVQKLNDVPRRNPKAVAPVIEFMERLAERHSITPLKSWIADYCTENGESGALVDLQNRLALANATDSRNATLYVDFSQAADTARPVVRFWLYDAAHNIIGADHVEVTPATGEDFETARSRAFGTLLQRASELLAGQSASASLCIELFVKLEQLAWNFDGWKVYVGEEDSPTFGINHPIVLRWIERSRHSYPFERSSAWNRVAANIRAHVGAGVVPSLQWLEKNGQDPALVETDIKAPDFSSVILLRFVPGFDAASDTERRLLQATLRGGAPYVLWWRTDQTDDALRTELQKVFESEPFDRFAGKSAQLRRAAAKGEGKLGKAIVIVWDDPTRNPISQLLSHPTQRAS